MSPSTPALVRSGPRSATSARRRGWLAHRAIAVATTLLAGCESPAPRAGPAEQPPPASEAAPPQAVRPSPATTQPRPSPPPAAAPRAEPPAAPTEPENPPPPAPPSPQDSPAPPKLPEYLRIVERIDAGRPVRVDAATRANGVLTLSTANVKRLRLERSLMPMNTARSIAVRVDGQAIEWTARHEWIELERSSVGQWTVSRRYPDQP